jgi:hypothetical protein
VGTGGAPRAASGIVLLAGSSSAGAGAVTVEPVTVGAALIRTAGQGTYRVDGSLRDLVAPSRWRFVGRDGVFSVFAQASASGRAWVTGAAPGAARVVSDTPWGDETIRVDAPRRAVLIRSVQFATGWQATVTPVGAGGRAAVARAVPVERSGLLQSVSVPAGTDLVRFTYRPSRAYEGLAVSAAGVAAVVVLVGGPPLVRRRRRRA